MKQFSLILVLLLFFTIPLFISAKTFSVKQPSGEEVINAIIGVSKKTKVRSAVLFGLFALETTYGTDLGKTESEWKASCASRNTSNCRKWKKYDCQNNYPNAKGYDQLLIKLGFVDDRGNADKREIPTSSTCALGFTQVVPNTWQLVTRNRQDRVYNPWNINDSILVAAYYLEDLGADNRKPLDPGQVMGDKDKIALQRYYCGSDYKRPDCAEYARSVEIRSRTAREDILRADLERQLEILEEEKRSKARSRGVVEAAVYCPDVFTDDFSFGVLPDSEKAKEAVAALDSVNRELLEVLRQYQRTKAQELVKEIQELAQKRKAFLVEAMYRNSDKALYLVLLENDRNEISRITNQCVEKEEMFEGIVEALHIDFEDGGGQSLYTLSTSGGESVILHPALGLSVSLESGTKVKVSGIRIDNELIFNGSQSLGKARDFSGGIDVLP